MEAEIALDTAIVLGLGMTRFRRFLGATGIDVEAVRHGPLRRRLAATASPTAY